MPVEHHRQHPDVHQPFAQWSEEEGCPSICRAGLDGGLLRDLLDTGHGESIKEGKYMEIRNKRQSADANRSCIIIIVVPLVAFKLLAQL